MHNDRVQLRHVDAFLLSPKHSGTHAKVLVCVNLIDRIGPFFEKYKRIGSEGLGGDFYRKKIFHQKT